MHIDENTARLRAALEWYHAMGVDIMLGDAPRDRFAEYDTRLPGPSGMRSFAPPPPAESTMPVPSHMQPESHNVEEARRIAAAAASLEELRHAMLAFEGCPLKFRATNTVFADGNPNARIVLVGEAPGRDEDLQGRCFAGRSGQLLDRIIASIGLDRSKVFIVNTIPWRPPGNRNPTPVESAVCHPFLVRQIELVAPAIIVALGGAASTVLFEAGPGILRFRGRWHTLKVGSHTCRGIATLHPAYLLRQPGQKHLVWKDMLQVKSALQTLPDQ